MGLKRENVLKPWKVGTNIKTYYEKLLSSIRSEVNDLNYKTKFYIKKTKDESYIFTSEVDENKNLYISSKGKNDFSKATFNQMLTTLRFLDVIKFIKEPNKNEEEYCVLTINEVFISSENEWDKIGDSIIESMNKLYAFLDENSWEEENELKQNDEEEWSQENVFKMAFNFTAGFDLYLKTKLKNTKYGLLFNQEHCDKEALEEYYFPLIEKLHNNKNFDFWKKIEELITKFYALFEVYDLQWSKKDHFELSKNLEINKQNIKINQNNSKIYQLNFFELIYQNESYNIPINQRDYAWDEHSINFAFQTIYNNFLQNNQQDNETYFGSLIFNKKNSFSIVDGQQRIISFTLILIGLIKAIFCLYKDFDKELSDNIKVLVNKNSKLQQKIEDFHKRNTGYLVIEDIFNGTFDEEDNKFSFTKKKVIKNYNEVCKLIFQKFYLEETKKEEQLKQLISFTEYFLEKIAFAFVIVNYSSSMENNLFASVNYGGKKISSIDLIRNKVFANYSNESDEEVPLIFNEFIAKYFSKVKDNVEDAEKLENFLDLELKNNNYNDYIKDLKKQVKDSIQLNYKKFEFLYNNIYKNKLIESNSPKEKAFDLIKILWTRILLFEYFQNGVVNKINKNVFDYIDQTKENQENRNELKGMLKQFEEFIYKIKFINNQIETINQQGSMTVFIPIINSIFKLYFKDDAFQKLKEDLDFKKLHNISTYLRELEIFSILWKFGNFSGESLNNQLTRLGYDIEKTIDTNQSIIRYPKDELKKKLIGFIKLMKNQTPETMEKNFFSYIENNIYKETANKQKHILIKKIIYCLQNSDHDVNDIESIRDNLVYKRLTENEGLFIDKESNFTYEHIYPVKNNENYFNKLSNSQKEEYGRLIQEIGNGSIISRSLNAKKGNRSSKDTKSSDKNNISVYGSELLKRLEINDNFDTMNGDKIINEISQKIKSRTKQYEEILKIIFDFKSSN